MLTSRQSIDDLIASLLPAGWRLDLLHWRDDDMWEVHLFDGQIVWLGYGDEIELALAQATAKLGGSFNRAQRPAAHQPAVVDSVLTKIIEGLKPQAKINIGRRL